MPLNIGKSIRVIRQAKGLLLKDVAGAASVSNPFLALVEKGERQPSLAVLSRIAEALEVPVEALILISQPPGTAMRTTCDRAERIVASVRRLAAAEEMLRNQLEARDNESNSILIRDTRSDRHPDGVAG
jgi:transcriptional regulator with XRE-family HTH domain